MSKTTNIFDAVETNLDQRIFDGIEPRRSVIKFIKRVYYHALDRRLGVIGTEWADLYLTGSLTTYQYSPTSDADVSVFPNYNLIWTTLNIDPHEARKRLVDMSINYLDGTFLPGTQHPLQFFVVPPGISPGDMYQLGLRSGYDILHGGWLAPPERSRSHNVQMEMPDAFERAADIAEKLTLMLDAGDYDSAREVWHNVHAKRQLDQRAGLGDYSEGNIVYKWLLHEGLFDRIRSELNEYIASVKVSMPPANQAPDFFKEFQHTPNVEEDFAPKRGFDWEVDQAAVMKLRNLPTWPVKRMTVNIMHPHQQGWRENLGWYDRNNVWLHPFLSPEQANFTLWHEIQHLYQDQEGRINLENYKFPTYNDYENGEEVDLDQYENHPIELDANEFANYMNMGLEAKSALIKRAEPLYDPHWVPNELHLDRGEWDEQEELWQLTPEQLKKELDAQVNLFRSRYHFWQDTWEPTDYDQYGGRYGMVDHLWDDRITTKIIYDFDKDRIILGTQADLPKLHESNKIVGEYADGRATLFEADKQWINPSYFRRLWHVSYPERELKDVYFRRETGDEYKLKDMPRKRKKTAEDIEPWDTGRSLEIDGRKGRYPFIALDDGRVLFGPEGGSHQMIARYFQYGDDFEAVKNAIAIGEVLDDGESPTVNFYGFSNDKSDGLRHQILDQFHNGENIIPGNFVGL